jgi:Integrase core domain
VVSGSIREYQLYLSIEDIDHTKTKVKSPPTNGICERFHRTILNEFYQIAFRKKLYQTLEELQSDADEWMQHYNGERPPSGRYCYGKTPLETFAESNSRKLGADSDDDLGELPFDEQADRKRCDELEKDFDRVFDEAEKNNSYLLLQSSVAELVNNRHLSAIFAVYPPFTRQTENSGWIFSLLAFSESPLTPDSQGLWEAFYRTFRSRLDIRCWKCCRFPRH